MRSWELERLARTGEVDSADLFKVALLQTSDNYVCSTSSAAVRSVMFRGMAAARSNNLMAEAFD